LSVRQPVSAKALQIVGVGIFGSQRPSPSSRGLHDAQHQKIKHFPFVRLDRFSETLKNQIDVDSPFFDALVDRLSVLDRQARMNEIADAGLETNINTQQVGRQSIAAT
jgi:hypothetical protein